MTKRKRADIVPATAGSFGFRHFLFWLRMFGKARAPRLPSQTGLCAHDSLVSCDLVRRGARALFRPKPTDLADLAGTQRDYWERSPPEHAGGDARRDFTALGCRSSLSDALLRVQLLRLGERARLYPDLFIPVERNADCGGDMRPILRIRRLVQTARSALQSK